MLNLLRKHRAIRRWQKLTSMARRNFECSILVVGLCNPLAAEFQSAFDRMTRHERIYKHCQKKLASALLR